MLTILSRFWKSVSYAGVSPNADKREVKGILVLNRAWLILITVQTVCLVGHIINGLHRSALLTAFYVLGLIGIHWFMRHGYINKAKIYAIGVINFNTLLMAYLLGPHTHVINFLLLTALLPMYLFNTGNRKLIFWGTALSVVPYALYQYTEPYFAQYALPLSEQLSIYKTTACVMVCSIVALLYLIYEKNASYEADVHETEDRLINQKKLYERILEQIPIDIATFDKDLRYTYINSTAIKDPEMRQWLLGKTNVEYFTERNLDLSVANDRNRILHEALAKCSKVEVEETMIDRHGALRTSIKGASPVYDDKNEVLCLIGYSLDITSIKDAERKVREYAVELERKNDDLQHFVNATSHDLKSPLRNIASYLQLLEKRNKEVLDEDSLSMISFTVKSVKHLNQLINDIYQYTVAGRAALQNEVTDLNAVMNDVLKEMAMNIAAKNAIVDYTPLPTIKANASNIGMLFSNLIGNGIKYNNNANPHIQIACTETNEAYVISISDNGIGIPSEYSKQVFEMFKRLHTTDVYEGTGVGLAICKKIIENYKGKIWVESVAEKGSAFIFTLPKTEVSPNVNMRYMHTSNKMAIAG